MKTDFRLMVATLAMIVVIVAVAGFFLGRTTAPNKGTVILILYDQFHHEFIYERECRIRKT